MIEPSDESTYNEQRELVNTVKKFWHDMFIIHMTFYL